MVFSSLNFLFIFLPVFLLLYYTAPRQMKNAVLLIGSLVFYGYGTKDQPFYLLLMVVSIVLNFAISHWIAESRGRKKRRGWLLFGLIYNFGWLFFFKYLGFVIENINQLSGMMGSEMELPQVGLVLPVGISFYTFQVVSYLLDVYWRRVKPEPRIVSFGAYLSMFPQLIAGPIVEYPPIAGQLRRRRHNLDGIEEGLRVFTIGLGLKVLLANQLGRLWNDVNNIGYESISTPLAWLGIIGYSLQIYFDFFGYSLMAIGLGRLLGFRMPENFRHPYQSLTMTEFWRRWHITLGSWFREYVYIPLGGNKNGVMSLLRNTLIVWLLTGIWHGASWNFVLWGLVLCLLILIEKAGVGNLLNKVPLLGHLYMCLVIPLTWLLFAITDFSDLRIYFYKLFPFLGDAGEVIFAGDFIKYGKNYWYIIIIGLILCTDYPARICRKWKRSIFSAVLLLVVFWASVYSMYRGLDDPFLYFRF